MKSKIPDNLKDCVPKTENYSFSDFENLYDKYGGAFYRIILNAVNDTEAANKILENTFCYAFKNINQYNASKALLFTWIKNIMHAHINMHFKKE